VSIFFQIQFHVQSLDLRLTCLISVLSLSSSSVCCGKALFSGPIFASFFSAVSDFAPVARLLRRSSSSASSRSRIRL
jgi:uncharacterized membrane protein YgdD (TMEM256/DUF423 family)